VEKATAVAGGGSRVGVGGKLRVFGPPLPPAPQGGGEQAASAAEAFKPLVVYPYHYGKDGAEPAKFAAAMKSASGIQVRQKDWYAYG
jgi:L-ascorbate metabolism protein UlaG (beta-lactamase superfamily)